MDDAFTLLRRAVDLLPEDAMAESGGVTTRNVREEIARQEWEMALDLLIELADVRPVPESFWEDLAEAARQMMLDRRRRWCRWRGREVRHGTVRVTLTLLGKDEGGRQAAFSGDGRHRPLWDIGERTSGGEPDLRIASVWVEFAQELGPGETADVRLAPLSPEAWRDLKTGDRITMHEGRPAVGTATVIEALRPSG